jgi:hypothetical protein
MLRERATATIRLIATTRDKANEKRPVLDGPLSQKVVRPG